MTRQQAHSRWDQVKGRVKQRWDRLTDEDIEQVRGNLERLVDALRDRYGYDRWSAEKEINSWRRTLRAAS